MWWSCPRFEVAISCVELISETIHTFGIIRNDRVVLGWISILHHRPQNTRREIDTELEQPFAYQYYQTHLHIYVSLYCYPKFAKCFSVLCCLTSLTDWMEFYQLKSNPWGKIYCQSLFFYSIRFTNRRRWCPPVVVHRAIWALIKTSMR